MNNLFPLTDTDKFQSKEELYFYWFLVDLYNAGYVSNVLYEPFTYSLSEPLTKTFVTEKKLKTKVKVIEGEESILKGLVYTPDFVVHWTQKALGVFVETLNTNNKLMKGQFVNLVKLPSLFKKYFVPTRFLITDKSAKLRKIKFNVRTMEQFITEV